MSSEHTISHKIDHSASYSELLESDERLGDPTMRRDYFAQLDETEFIELLQHTSSVVRTGDVSEQNFDGNRVHLNFHAVPDQGDKEQLLRDTWNVAKEFLQDPTIDDQDALDYAALTVAGGVLYVHPFKDGNGRTARAVTYMLTHGPGDQDELSRLLTKSNGGGEWYIAPINLIAAGRSKFGGNQPSAIEWVDEMAGEEKDALGGAIARSINKNAILRRFIEQRGDQIKVMLDDATTTDDEGHTILQSNAFIDALVHDAEGGMTNSRELLALEKEARADYVRRFLRAMQITDKITPGKFGLYNTEPGDKDTEITTKLKGVVRTEMAKRATNGMLTPADRQIVQHRVYSNSRHKEYPGAA